jgi:hypothetical protein
MRIANGRSWRPGDRRGRSMTDERIDPKVIGTAMQAFYKSEGERPGSMPFYAPMEAAIRAADRERAKGAKVVYVARCSEHGLHGCRDTCFECGEPVEQVPMVELERGGEDA